MWEVTSSSRLPDLCETLISTEPAFWVSLASGLPDRYRIPFLAVFAAASAIGLGLLAYKLRTADASSGQDGRVNSKLERTDLLEGGDPDNVLEWIIAASSNRNAYLVLIGSTLGLAVFLGAMGEFPGVAAALVFASVLFGLQGFLRFGWPHVEAYYERRQPDERDANSLKFQGLSTDALVLLTLFGVAFAGMLLLVGLEMLFS